VTERVDPRRLRPWYLVVAAGLLWVMGLVGASSSYRELSHLRGDQTAVDQLDEHLFDTTHPVFRLQVEYQRAYLVALGHHHDRAFPVALATLLLQGLLVWAAGALIAGRRNGRRLMLQALGTNAVMVVVGYLALAPARAEAMTVFAGEAATLRGLPAGPDQPTDEAIDFLVEQQPAQELGRTGAEVAFYLLVAMALYRPRARTYFAALEENTVADAEES